MSILRESPSLRPLWRNIVLALLLLIGSFLLGVVATNSFRLLRGLPFASGGPQEVDLVPYANGNIERDLVLGFPTGEVVPPNNNLGVPFFIPPTGNNFIHFESVPNGTVIIPVHKRGVRRVYMLIQAYGPMPGANLLRVEFNGDAGGLQTFDLFGGDQVRDFFESRYEHRLSSPMTRSAFQFNGQGAAFSSLAATGWRGYYNFDEQEFVLGGGFATQELQSIKLACPRSGGVAMLLGITVDTSVIPSPSAILTAAARVSVVASCLVLLAIVLVIIAVLCVSSRAMEIISAGSDEEER
jgi:hypothetical protein